MSLSQKYYRYKSIISNFSNWPQYFLFKVNGAKSFRFRMKSGFELNVSRQMMAPFKEIFFDHVYTRSFPDLFLKTAEPTILDIGGNVGFFSLFVFSQAPKAKVFTFEPIDFNYQQMLRYKQKFNNLNWDIIPKAVSKSNEPLFLHSDVEGDFTTVAGIFGDNAKKSSLKVETITYSQILNQFKIEKVDLLKMDCEGSEYSILYSIADEQFERIERMSIETHQGNDPQETHEALVAFLRNKGYDLAEFKTEEMIGYVFARRTP